MIMPSESKVSGVCCAFLVIAFSCSLASASPDGHFLRTLRAPGGSASHFLRSLRSPDDFADAEDSDVYYVDDDDGDDGAAEEMGGYVKRGYSSSPTYLRDNRMDNSHFLRALRAPAGGSSHFLRSLRAPQRSSHFLRSLRGPSAASHFLRSLRGPGGSSSHFLRSLRSPSGGSSHFLRSLRSTEEVGAGEEAAATKRAVNNAHFLRSL